VALRPRFSPGVLFSIMTVAGTTLQVGTDPVKKKWYVPRTGFPHGQVGEAVRAAMRPSAASQPASNGWPG
jgi:hypothetical protein